MAIIEHTKYRVFSLDESTGKVTLRWPITFDTDSDAREWLRSSMKSHITQLFIVLPVIEIKYVED